MVTDEEFKAALDVVERYKNENYPKEPVSKCDHRGSWLTVKGNYYCQFCDSTYDLHSCKICSGKGHFEVNLKNMKEINKEDL